MEDKKSITSWFFALVGITIGVLWVMVLLLAPAALIKLCWAFLTT